MDFEWDENKNITNIAKHGYDFRDVIEVFTDKDLFVYPSSYNLEERYIAVSRYEGKYITLIYTVRDQTIRLISSRRARKKEIKDYEQAKRKDR